ncbi:hypothetical protein DIZ76_014593 [Coccidioides immitis]|nr:hypothetical protein DIZ76_014593 [Coccidioides immitis]
MLWDAEKIRNTAAKSYSVSFEESRNVRPHDGKALTNFGPSEQTMSPKQAYRAQL